MQRLILLLLVFLFATALGARAARAEKRIALVIGNAAYQNVPRLANPAGDAAAMADMFRSARFDFVDLKRNLSIVEMRRALRDFSDKARDADVAVIFYAGHGLEVEGMNYLIPVDAMLERDRDAYDEAIALDRVLQTIDSAKLLRLVILDACRDNPFNARMQRTLANRALGRGLAGIEPARPNTLIAFAAKAGSTANDGTGTHSPFTASLLKYLPLPGVDVRLALGEVRDDVMKATSDTQEPFVYGSLGGSAVALVPAPPPKPTQKETSQAEIRRDYELALQLDTREAWETFIAQYPTGFYANLARAQLNKRAAEEVRAAAAEKARQAEAEKQRLAAVNATAAAQAKAAADARAAEDARLAAEKLNAAEQAKAEAAERARAEAERAAEAKVAEDAQKHVEQQGTQIASLPPQPETAKPSAPLAMTANEISHALQAELRRVGCLTGTTDGAWAPPSQRAMERFNQFAKTGLDAKLASLDALDAVKAKPGRVCPLVCGHGFRADGDACVKITCKSGYIVGDDNTCERIEPRKPRNRPTVAAKPAGAPPSNTRTDCRIVNIGGGNGYVGSPALDPRPRCIDVR